MNKTKVLTVLLMMLAIPTWVFADFTDQIDRFEFGPVAGVGFYFGQKNPVENSDLLRVQSYDPIAFGEERATLRWPGIETFGFSLGYRIDTRWTVTLKAVHQRVCFAEYDTIKVPESDKHPDGKELQRGLYYNTMWHVDAMAEYNLLNLGNAMVPEQSIYNVVPYVGLGIGVTLYNQNATFRGFDPDRNLDSLNTTFPKVGTTYRYNLSDTINPIGIGLYIPMVCGVKWRINDNVQLKASFQYQLYFSNRGKGGLNSNLEGATKLTYGIDVPENDIDKIRIEQYKNRPGFSDLKKQIVGANHDCIFSISAIFNLSKWKEDRLILY